MYLKIMSDQDLPDEDARKNFALIECDRVFFKNADGGGVDAMIWDGDDAYHEPLTGNAYLMDASGKTIAHKWCECVNDEGVNDDDVKVTSIKLDMQDGQVEKSTVEFEHIARTLTEGIKIDA